ncbi:hypothetical protein SFRURICE_007817 [Spodoptera frugiperda]|nr:hypothetical protein SFRURICE_007817 [Spodoptera frugiperda]
MAASPKDSQSTSKKKGPCPWLCELVPANLPPPGPAQTVLHPRKDVFVLKNWDAVSSFCEVVMLAKEEAGRVRERSSSRPSLKEPSDRHRWADADPELGLDDLPLKKTLYGMVAKVGPTGDRRCKMELELVTPKGPEKRPPCRIDTRETQCEPDPPPCTCCMRSRSKRRGR